VRIVRRKKRMSIFGFLAKRNPHRYELKKRKKDTSYSESGLE
jgi:hypothetical protein